MIDRLFTAVLTFALLAGGTVAVGDALFDTAPGAQAVAAGPAKAERRIATQALQAEPATRAVQ